MTKTVASLDERLLNDYQRDFPLVSQPFAEIADELDTGTAEIVARLRALKEQGSVSRVGPVFRPNAIGASTLAAMAVPPADLHHVAQLVNAYPQVNHNYEREHRFNLWFVVTADSESARDDTLAQIETDTGYQTLSLPLERDYHIDLGFHMSQAACATRAREVCGPIKHQPCPTSAADAALIGVIQGGLPLVERPFLVTAQRSGQTEAAVIQRIRDWLDDGTIKRFGVIVRHHELGYRANAMAVWDIPNEQVDELGDRFAALPWVTLCYRRRRQRPHWPFNLYCMIHGRERHAVRRLIARMVASENLDRYAHAVLFSGRRFKQRGARYRTASAPSRQHRVAHGYA